MRIVFTLAAFFFGTVIGSFLSVLIYRIRFNKKHTIKSRSECVKCKETIAPHDLIPLVSYLVLRGKCRNCSTAISIYYPLIELFTGVLFALMYLKYPFISENGAFSGNAAALFLLNLYFMSVLSFSFFYDLKYMFVSDRVMIPAILIALISSVLPGTPHIIDSLLGALIAFTLFAVQIVASRGKWLGGGDVRIGVFMGLVLGWEQTIVALFMAYIVGACSAVLTIVTGDKGAKSKVPFVPFLVIGTLISLFLGRELIDWYLGSFNV